MTGSADMKTGLNDRAQEALAYFFAIHWAALCLNPRGLQTIRSTMKDFGLVKPKGKLSLTPLGKQIIKFAQADDRPKYPRKRP